MITSFIAQPKLWHNFLMYIVHKLLLQFIDEYYLDKSRAIPNGLILIYDLQINFSFLVLSLVFIAIGFQGVVLIFFIEGCVS